MSFVIQDELNKSLEHMSSRKHIQNNRLDILTRYIYTTDTFDELVTNTKLCSKLYVVDYDELFSYAINRWFNKTIALYAEDIFAEYDIVDEERNEKHKIIDFYINWIPFDLKLSVFPKWFNNTIEYAEENKIELIDWLYNNASKEWRHHNWNKIFIICYSEDWNHNRIKWNLEKIKEWIDNYMKNYNEDNLYIVWDSLSDIIIVK